jgi:hypothetical protein
MHIDLSDQVILLTGASRGIGRAIALALGEAGATLAVHYGRNQAAAEEVVAQLGGKSQAFQADLSDWQAALRLAEKVQGTYQRIDCLVNNAGVAEGVELQAAPEAWVASWQRTQAVNLLAPALLSKAVIPDMASKGGGRLIHIASRAAFRGDTPDYLAYAASKEPFARPGLRSFGSLESISSKMLYISLITRSLGKTFLALSFLCVLLFASDLSELRETHKHFFSQRAQSKRNHAKKTQRCIHLTL